jgi:hypothetical protein
LGDERGRRGVDRLPAVPLHDEPRGLGLRRRQSPDELAEVGLGRRARNAVARKVGERLKVQPFVRHPCRVVPASGDALPFVRVAGLPVIPAGCDAVRIVLAQPVREPRIREAGYLSVREVLIRALRGSKACPLGFKPLPLAADSAAFFVLVLRLERYANVFALAGSLQNDRDLDAEVVDSPAPDQIGFTFHAHLLNLPTARQAGAQRRHSQEMRSP